MHQVMTTKGNVKLGLLATIQAQEELIHQQHETIMALVNETVEQESIITAALMKEYLDTEEGSENGRSNT